MAHVDIRDVRKSFGAVEVLHGVSVDVPDGSFTVLVGPSGCGKSTLLRMVAGLEEITSGDIAIGERVVNRVAPKERDIAMVFQNYALYPHMKVFDNMAFSLKLARVDQSLIRQRVEEAARILNLTDYLERYPRQLSGGQRQRVAMGRAIVRKPQVFLFDEPLSNLDAKLRVQMRGEIKQLQKRLGTTSIYVTHDQLEAMTLADRLVVLNAGRIEQIGSPLEVYRKPASTFVAGFIGSPAMNLFEASYDGSHFRLGEGALPFSASLPAGEVLLGVRAEDLSPAPGTDGGGLPVTVSYVEELGAQRLVHGHTSGQPITVALGVDLQVPPSFRLIAAPAALHVFDRESQQRLNP